MKFTELIFLAAIPAVTLAAPTQLQEREASVAVVDNLMFGISLPAFESARNSNNPSDVDYSSDGCTSSPDNPFGFNFVPACHRHDFGYQNFRIQQRFTESNKARIDSNFKKDLYYQCSFEEHRSSCEDTADVYYAAVKEFGGDDATPGKKLKIRVTMELDGKKETMDIVPRDVQFSS